MATSATIWILCRWTEMVHHICWIHYCF